MSATLARRPATYADLEAVPPHLVAEIVDGLLETHPRPRPLHVAVAFELSTSLGPPFRRGQGGPGGWIFMVEPELHLGADVVVPDLAGWRRDRMPTEPKKAFIEVPPDWVCEILSPSTARLDRGPKRRIYAEHEVSHLWLLDPEAGDLEGFALESGRWVLLATVGRGEAVSIAPFDAISFPFDDLFPFDDPPPAAPES